MLHNLPKEHGVWDMEKRVGQGQHLKQKLINGEGTEEVNFLRSEAHSKNQAGFQNFLTDSKDLR